MIFSRGDNKLAKIGFKSKIVINLQNWFIASGTIRTH